MFQDKHEYKKGSYAENLVFDFLRGKGYVVYRPNNGCAHGFDILAVKNKETLIIAECKAKARRNHYEDTGVNERHLLQYQYVQEKYNIPVYIFFIDEMVKQIYGNFIDNLLVPQVIPNSKGKMIRYPLEQNGIVYFPLINMTHVKDICDEDANYLREESTRSYDYEVKL